VFATNFYYTYFMFFVFIKQINEKEINFSPKIMNLIEI
jgi:hypothetical protein